MHIFCRLGRHVHAATVDWDGENYRSVCVRCGRQVVRVRHGVWRAARTDETRTDA